MFDYNTPVKKKLTGFRYYAENIEQFFHQRENHLKDLVQDSFEKGEHPWTWWADDYWLTTETNLMRMSLFLSLYAFLELILNELCRFEQIEREVLLSPSDLSGKGIERSKTYLTKVIGVDFPFGESKEWVEIKNYQKLRNHLAHAGLRLAPKSSKDPLEKILKQHSKLHHRNFDISNNSKAFELSQAELQELKQLDFGKKTELMFEGFLGSGHQSDMYDDDIQFKAGFCREVIETIDSFWKQLIEKVQSANT